jgi:hypothetical protein
MKQTKKAIKQKPVTESVLQSQCVAWFRAQHPEIIIFAIPNAAKRSFALAARMRKEGMVSGIPDLFIAKDSREGIFQMYNGLFIEMKRSDSEKTTANQDYYLQKLQEAGYKTAVCHSFDEFQQTVNEYLK